MITLSLCCSTIDVALEEDDDLQHLKPLLDRSLLSEQQSLSSSKEEGEKTVSNYQFSIPLPTAIGMAFPTASTSTSATSAAGRGWCGRGRTVWGFQFPGGFPGFPSFPQHQHQQHITLPPPVPMTTTTTTTTTTPSPQSSGTCTTKNGLPGSVERLEAATPTCFPR